MTDGNKNEHNALSPEDESMVQVRHEDSVLFTLSDLGKAAKPKSSKRQRRPTIDLDNEEEDASGYINIDHASTLFGGSDDDDDDDLVMPAPSAGNANDDASGFINLTALSSLQSAKSTSPSEGGFESIDPMAQAGVIPMGTRQSTAGIKIALSVAVGLLVVAIGVLVVVLLTRDKDPQIVERKAPTAEGNLGALKKPEEKKDPVIPPTKGTEEKKDEGALADKADEKKDEGDDKKDEADKAPEGKEDPKGTDKAAVKKDAPKGDTKKDAPAEVAKTDKKDEGDTKKDEADKKDEEAKDPPEDDKKDEEADKKPQGDSNLTGEKKDRMDSILDGLDGTKKKPPAEDKSGLPPNLTRNAVKSVVGRHRGRVLSCGGPGKAGTVIVRFTILPSGGVGGAKVAGEKAGTAEAACVASVVRSMKFPPFNGSSMTINYPFVLP